MLWYQKIPLQNKVQKICGGGEIRTHGALRHSRFQDDRTRPLCDASLVYKYTLFWTFFNLLLTNFFLRSVLQNDSLDK